MKKKKGFTLVELLAVIVVLAIILVIAVPKILDVIKSSRENSLISSVKLVARNAEQKRLANEVLGEDEDFDCSEVADLSSNDYQSCSITFDEEGNATVSITGKGKFSGYTCSGTKNNVTCGDTEPLVCTRGYEYDNYRIKDDLIDAEKDSCVDVLKTLYEADGYPTDWSYGAAMSMCKHELTDYYEGLYNDLEHSTHEEYINHMIAEGIYESIYTYEDIKDYFDADIVQCTPNYLAQDWAVISGFKEEIWDEETSIINITFHKSTSGFDGSGIDVSQAQDGGIKLYFNEDTGVVDIVSKETICFPQNSSHLFIDLSVKSIEFNDSIDTSNVIDMAHMFENCSSLIELDLSSFDTSNVTNMFEMFCGANYTDLSIDTSKLGDGALECPD